MKKTRFDFEKGKKKACPFLFRRCLTLSPSASFPPSRSRGKTLPLSPRHPPPLFAPNLLHAPPRFSPPAGEEEEGRGCRRERGGRGRGGGSDRRLWRRRLLLSLFCFFPFHCFRRSHGGGCIGLFFKGKRCCCLESGSKERRRRRRRVVVVLGLRSPCSAAAAAAAAESQGLHALVLRPRRRPR